MAARAAGRGRIACPGSRVEGQLDAERTQLLASHAPELALRRSKKVAFALQSCLGGALVCASPRALGAPMDPAPAGLVTQPANLPPGFTCQEIAQNPNLVLAAPFPAGALPNDYPCRPDNVAWANLMSELGMAIAPTAMHPARTTGYGGFALSIETTFTHINANGVAGGLPYWRAGTQGPGGPDSFIQVYALSARKGLPFGFEVAATVGYVAKTTLWTWGADVRWAPFEGYRTGALGALPDVAIGAGVRTLSGTSAFYLTTLGFDGELSKPLPLAGSAVLTPHLGAQRIIIFANSGSVDLTPSVDPYQQCGYTGQSGGMPVCSQKLANGAPDDGDFNNTASFASVRIYRWRGIAGLDYRYEILSLSAQFAVDLTEPGAENSAAGISGDRQWSVSLGAGLSF